MIGFILVVSLLVGSVLQASSEVVKTDAKTLAGVVQPDGQAQVVAGDKQVAAPKKEEKVFKTSEGTKQTPVTTSIFAQKTLTTMNFEELKKSKDEFVKSGNKASAIKFLERMVPICNDLNELKSFMLELAQLLHETGDYAKASKMYHEFTLLYPGSDEVEYAMYQAIASSFKQILDAEHDQTKTVETRELAQTFLDRASFATYKKEVQEVALKCDERLLESEINIFNFYMKRSNFMAAKTRLSTIKQAYSEKSIPDIGIRIALLEKNYNAVAPVMATVPVAVVATQESGSTAEAKV